jgi:ABC-type dipeptide/oligopeptide/nickel transport system permease component
MQWIGWLATAMFGASYLCKRPAALRTVQALAALLWIVYGALIHAVPVVVANLIVAAMALGTQWTRSRSYTPQQ